MFLIQMKKLIFLILTISLFVSCSDFQQLVRRGKTAEQYQAAEKYYNEGKYKKAIALFELVVPAYRGKPQAERVSYYEANAYYALGDFYIANYKFDRFAKSYPKSDKVEEARFKGARSKAELSNRSSLDQTETNQALEKFQSFINDYPKSNYLAKANEYTQNLDQRLEKKFYDIAKRYHHRELYKPAIASFDNYLLDYPGSKYMDEALYYRLESAYELAIKSFDDLIPTRLEETLEFYELFETRVRNEEIKEKGAIILGKIKEYQEKINL